MEFVINKNYFSNIISNVSHVTTSKSSIQMLSGIKIIADQSGLKLIGSNAEIVIEKFLPLNDGNEHKLEIHSYGSIVVPAKYLSEVVKKLPSRIHFKVTENNLIKIQSEDVITKLKGLNAAEYPSIPEVNLQNSISISGKEFNETIKQTVFAVASNDSRPALTGVNMAFDENKLTCVATNSHRLALKEIEIDSTIKDSIVVSQTTLKELIKLINSETSTIHISFSDNYVLFMGNNMRLFSRLIEGNYPEISKLIPKDSRTVLTLDSKRFSQGIDRACLFATESRNNNVRLKIKDGSKLIISSNTAEVGRIEETQMINTITGNKELTLSLDGKFLMDAIKTIKADEIKISMGGSMNPVLIEPLDDSTYVHLISPVRT
ncbi:DNA polymerase III subunit beta [Virgibacillus necropolis]|uniref:DNA polymerase III subunit beta n=1 Tax=Virgibacillus necropolis TaxID=163877 RepID=UPI0038500110